MHVCKVMTTNLYEILIESFFFLWENGMSRQKMNKVLSYLNFFFFLLHMNNPMNETPCAFYYSETRRLELLVKKSGACKFCL